MLVSVIMPTYNCGRFIAKSIDSVIAQTVTDWEICIVDDCSTDNTVEVLQPYLDRYPNIRYTRLEKNGGPAVARTEALRMATGKYVAFLDSDDLWVPEKLEKQIAFMEENGILFSCTAFRHIDEEGNLQDVVRIPPQKMDYNKMLYMSNPTGNLTMMYNREVLGDYEVHPIKKRNDFALWLQVLRDAPFCAGMPEVLAYYRIRSNSVTTSSKKFQLVKYHWDLYRNYEKLPLWKCVIATGTCLVVKVAKVGWTKVQNLK